MPHTWWEKDLRPGSLVVFESTVYPGVTEEVCLPIIRQVSGLEAGTDWSLGYSPERINPGDLLHPLETIPKIVAGMDAETTEELQQLYDLIIDAGQSRYPAFGQQRRQRCWKIPSGTSILPL